jgi:tRNA A-37 threonylcarbamoyl transferase component Bud32
MFRQATSLAAPSDFGLPSDLMAKARTRIAGLAGVLGALSLMAILLNATVFSEEVDSAVQPQHFLAVGLALVVIVTALSKRIGVTTALNVGLVYEVCLCWILSFSAQQAALVMTGRPPEVTWTSMVIVVFPMIVPLPPGRLLAASILAAISAPATLLVLDRMGMHGLTADEFISVSISPAFAVVLAYFGARMIYAIGLDVSRARLLGAYQLESQLGGGGMGEVWRASHRMLARPAAVKLIAPKNLGDDAHAVRIRFEQEAQATALLRSPHTVEVYDFGLSSDGSFYYVMELLDGLDLQQLVREHGPLPASRVVHILRQTCHSLGEAHAAGLIHRDIKPANIFVCRYGSDYDFVKVLDFGLVKSTGEEAGAATALTQEGSVAGTPAFMAPEMALGGGGMDGRADLYALGCVAYWLLTGQPVFAGETPVATLLKHVQEDPLPPSKCTETEIPADLEAVVMDCLHKKPVDRPSSAEELADRLSKCDVVAWTKHEAKSWWQLRFAGGNGVQHARFDDS